MTAIALIVVSIGLALSALANLAVYVAWNGVLAWGKRRSEEVGPKAAIAEYIAFTLKYCFEHEPAKKLLDGMVLQVNVENGHIVLRERHAPASVRSTEELSELTREPVGGNVHICDDCRDSP